MNNLLNDHEKEIVLTALDSRPPLLQSIETSIDKISLRIGRFVKRLLRTTLNGLIKFVKYVDRKNSEALEIENRVSLRKDECYSKLWRSHL